MPEYVEPAVRELCEKESDEMVDLLLGVSGDRMEFARNVQRLDSRIQNPEQVGRKSLRVSVPIDSVSGVCGLDGTKSIEVDEPDVRTHTESGEGQGNS